MARTKSKRQRGEYGKGHLYRRSKTWWLQYRVDGKCQRVSLGTDDKQTAKDRRDEIVHPLLLKDKQAQLEKVIESYDAGEKKRVAAVYQAKYAESIDEIYGHLLTADDFEFLYRLTPRN